MKKPNQKKPTAEQVKKEIAWLKANKLRVRQHTIFGDDHHAAIDAQIDVLENEMNCDDVHDAYKNVPLHVLEHALDVMHWRAADGWYSEAPSEEWGPLVMKESKK